MSNDEAIRLVRLFLLVFSVAIAPKEQRFALLPPYFSRYLENLSLNLSPTRRETLNFGFES
ncbi:hypothetical protein [Scytonema sp. PCC 10023]|uniref:hypothetical protein n=1 Tax=Scytonema sp. PCC 10023 TaxID=1680591 RepID=UPI0039C5AE01